MPATANWHCGQCRAPKQRCTRWPDRGSEWPEPSLRSREANETDWYLQRGSGLAPYQQRQMAQLTTGSDYAVCRGKRGPAEGRLCPCGAGCVETTAHALLQCPLYADIREAFDSAQHALRDAVAGTHKYELSAEEALRWAIDDMYPMHFEPGQRAIAALLSYRVAMLDFRPFQRRLCV